VETVEKTVFFICSTLSGGDPTDHLHNPRPGEAQGHTHRQGFRLGRMLNAMELERKLLECRVGNGMSFRKNIAE
jgi:hypothetical protein